MNLRSSLATLLVGAAAFTSPAATNNNGNPPAYLAVEICSNGIGDNVNNFATPRMQPDVFDIGLDVGADGTIDRWLSQEPATWLGGGNSDDIKYSGWIKLHFFQVSEHVGKPMRLRIVDKSAQYYMAIKSVMVNGADGLVVTNAINNGSFEAAQPLSGWTVRETSVSNPARLVFKDTDATYITRGTNFLTTRTDPASTDSSETAVIESDTFVLPGMSSFIVANVSGGASEAFNRPAANDSDNASGVYLDLGTASQDPNGRYDEGVDIPVRAFWPGAGTAPANDFGTVLLNTSGLEGRRAQVVAFDDSTVWHVSLDAVRMNWDWEETIIRNGGFDQGIPTPESDASATLWFSETGNALTAANHPSGSIPGWKVKKSANASADVWFFDASARRDHMTGRTFVGTGGGDRAATGVELRSDVFVITPIPSAESSVFVQFASAQGSDRIRYTDDGTDKAFSRIELIVDANRNGTFGDAGDFSYFQRNQSMALNQSNSGRDLWHFPEYRWYIRTEHRGLQAVFRAEDNFGAFKSSWGWMCLDDLFVWDGAKAALAFPNSDFEQGTLDNWTAQISAGNGFNSWLAGSQQALAAGRVTHSVMNNRSVRSDGDFAADTAARESGGGDDGRGVLTSMAFSLPQIATTTPTNKPIQLTRLDINNPVASSVTTNADGSFTVTAGGGDTWDNADSFTYLHESRNGDFDVQTKVISVEADDASASQKNAKGSLHVRANLTPGSPNIQLNASPLDGANYIETIFRPIQDGGTDDPPAGSIKVDAGPYEGTYRPSTVDLFPTWLRIKRERNLFQTMVSADGVRWSVLAEYQMDGFPTNVYVGLGAVAHISSSEDPANLVRATFADYRNTPQPPAALVGDQPAGANGPGIYPNATITAVNWNVSLPADGIGWTADKTESGPIVWNTGGFGTISRDILLTIDGQQGPLPFGISRYAAGALDFGIGVRDSAAAQENLGPYSNPKRRRIATPEASEASAQAWFPSPRHGVLVPTTRRNGAIQWKDGAAPFYANTFMAVDGSSTRHYSMNDGIFGGGDFYLRMAKLADTGTHPNSQANSAGGFQRAAFDCSVAWFPYAQGWKAGYFADASRGTKGWWSRPVSHSAAASAGTFDINRQSSAALLRWEEITTETFGGLATLSLPGVDSRADGLLFLTGNDDTTARGPQVNCAPTTDGTGWTVAVRSVEENKDDPTTYAAADRSEFSFVYVPLNAGGLVGGEIAGSTGASVRRAGNFTSSRLAAGRYLVQIPGKTGANGMLILQAVGMHPANGTIVDNVTLSYESSANGFVVESRALTPGVSQAPNSVQLRDASFYFAWVDFTSPLTPAGSSVPANVTLTVARTSSGAVLSWPASATGYVLESTPSLGTGTWTPVANVTGNSATVNLDGTARFFRLRQP
jgi:hypothetical protein